MKANELRGKSVVVTGASSGIGRATAIAFARKKANVILAARRQEALEEVEREARSFDVETLVVATDISDRVQVKALADAALNRFGKIDVFAANAGTYLRCPVCDLTVEQVEQVMAVNFYGCLYCLLEVVPQMVARRAGHIVVVASVDAKKGIPPDGAYVASKFAITGLAEVLRQELRGTDVHLTTVFPGRVDTPMIERVRVPSISPKIPPDRVAEAIVKAVLKPKHEVLVPHLSSKTLVVANALSSRMADRLVSSLRLGGWDEN